MFEMFEPGDKVRCINDTRAPYLKKGAYIQ